MENKDYEEQSFSHTVSSFSLNRREFLKRMGILGGGIIVYFSFDDATALAQHPPQTGKGGKGPGQLFSRVPKDFNAFLSIGADGRVTCLTGKIEMGQGINTSLAQTLADELDVPFDKVDMIMGDTDLCPWDMGTFGSMTTRYFGPALRAAAAEARAVLIELASDFLKIPVDRLAAKDGVISEKTRPKNRVSYAQLAKGKRIERHLKEKPALKAVSEFTVIGKPFTRTDAVEKVTGKAMFAGDIRLPNLLYAKILRPPAHGAKLMNVDTSQAKKIEGALVVKDGDDLIAVLHKHPDKAEEALVKIKAEFDLSKTNIDDKNIYVHLQRVAPEGSTLSQGGNLKTGENLSTLIVEETYLNSYVAHATIETHTAMASIEGNKVTVWASTQRPFAVKDSVARALGFPAQNVRVITPFVGGGFGGKGQNREAIEAARLAKLTGKPVQVAWSRAEDFFYDHLRPAALVKIKSGINRAGNIVLWDYDVYFAGDDGAKLFYDVPHHKEIFRGGWMRASPGTHPFSVGAWRAPATNTNTFARESHIDIMASQAGKDPIEFRLKHLKDKKMQRVLKAAAEKFGWPPPKALTGRGYGVACSIRSGSYVATIAEVEANKSTGTVQVKRIVHAQDMGLVINPEGAMLQIEGCITMGLGYALKEGLHFKDGEIFDLNFDTYEIPRFSWLPKIETVLIPNDSPPQGGGEPAIVCMGAVIANAIFDAIGVRLFELPMTPEKIREALK